MGPREVLPQSFWSVWFTKNGSITEILCFPRSTKAKLRFSTIVPSECEYTSYKKRPNPMTIEDSKRVRQLRALMIQQMNSNWFGRTVSSQMSKHTFENHENLYLSIIAVDNFSVNENIQFSIWSFSPFPEIALKRSLPPGRGAWRHLCRWLTKLYILSPKEKSFSKKRTTMQPDWPSALLTFEGGEKSTGEVVHVGNNAGRRKKNGFDISTWKVQVIDDQGKL